MQRVPCGAKGLATPILDEVQEMANEDEVMIIATVKCVAQAEAVEESEQGAPAGVLVCSTVVSMNVAGRTLLLETMGARHAGGSCRALRHFKNRGYQPHDGMESSKDATIALLETLICDQRLVLGWRLGLDLASLGIGVTTVLASVSQQTPWCARSFRI